MGLIHLLYWCGSQFMKSEPWVVGCSRAESAEGAEVFGERGVGEFLTTDHTDLHGWMGWDYFLLYF